MEKFIHLTETFGPLFALILCAVSIYGKVNELNRPRYIKKKRKFKKMINDGNLLKLTAQRGIAYKHRYTKAANMFVSEQEE